MGCFDSLGVKKYFKNYKHMHDFFSQHSDGLKRLRISFSDAMDNPVDDWTTQEKMAIQRELVGYYDKSMLVAKYQKTFDEFDINGVDEVPDEQSKRKVWGVVEATEKKTTKTGKLYATVTVSGLSDKNYTFRAWDTDLSKTNLWIEGSVVVFSLDYNEDFGYNLNKQFKAFRLTK
jgi:DNA polymerase III alpha subunit